jgi:hypothetical protein
LKNLVAVEKLLPAKFAKITSRQDALQTTFLVFPDIFYPSKFLNFEENGVFQQPLAITLIDPKRAGKCIVSYAEGVRSATLAS